MFQRVPVLLLQLIEYPFIDWENSRAPIIIQQGNVIFKIIINIQNAIKIATSYILMDYNRNLIEL